MSETTSAQGAGNHQHTAADGFRVVLGVGGLIAVVLGLLILLFPEKSGAVTMQIVAAITAAYALVVGVVYLGSAIFSRVLGGWARVGHIVLGVLYVAGGAVMMANLGATAVVLTVFLSVTIGVLWLIEAVVSFTVAGQSANKVWSIVYGIVSVLAGLTLIFSPILGAVTLWILLGASMLVMGIVQAIRAIRFTPAG
ncbi:HdeD family acid-resistance protein [Leucobacter luti]|uniref:HdeD family acid-resistance protein n=1 Tax=Leucobacter luti TaxID=340320 RepID=UPI003D00454D